MNADRIREREDNRMLDRLHSVTIAEARQEERDRAAAEHAERIMAALSETLDVQKCLKGGTLDYEAAGGVLVEYGDEVIEALRCYQKGPAEEIARLKHEIINLNFALRLFRESDALATRAAA